MSLPENQRKLEAVEQLAEVATDAGCHPCQLAIAFVTNHPAVTSAIIGPRTMEQLEGQLPSSNVTLTPETLDHIDAIVAPRGRAQSGGYLIWRAGAQASPQEAVERVAVAMLPEPMMLMVVMMNVPPSCAGQLAVMVLPA